MRNETANLAEWEFWFIFISNMDANDMNCFYNFLFRSCLILVAFYGLIGCAEDGAGEPEEPIPSIQIDEENSALVFSEEEGTAEIFFQVQGLWRAVVMGPADGWCKVTPSKGGTGTAWVRVHVQANELTEERNATIMIQCGDVSKNVVVTQKAMNALTLTKSKWELGREGGSFEVEIKSNISYEYEIDVECNDWIEAEATRSMQTSTLRFKVAAYDGKPVREGRIRFFGGGVTETIRIYQEGTDPAIVVSQKEYVLSAEEATIGVELCSNVDFEVEMPEVGWVTDVSTRVLSSHTLYYAVAKNTSEEDRTAEIRYTDRVTGCSNTVRIVQKGKNVAVVAKQFYKISPVGGYISFDVNHNNGFDVRILDSWVERVYRRMTRSMKTEEVILKITGKGYAGAPRTALIDIVSSDGAVLEQVRIQQTDEMSIVRSEDDALFSWEGGDFLVEIEQGMPFSFSIYSNSRSWVRYVETIGNIVRFHIEKNGTTESRSSYIEFSSPAVKYAQSVYIDQLPKNSVVLASDSYDVPNKGGIVEVEVKKYGDGDFTVDISDDWVERIESSAKLRMMLGFKVAPNPEHRYRKATVRLIPDDGSEVQRFRIYQVPEDAVIVSEHEYVLSDRGGLATVEIRAGTDYSIDDPDVAWLRRENDSRTAERMVVNYTAEPNQTYESREAVVVVRNRKTGEEEKVRFTQLQKNALVVSESVCRVEREGGTLEFDVRTNVPLEVEVESAAQSWLSRVETRALSNQTLFFEATPTESDREGLITIRGGGITQTVSVLQGASDDFASIERQALSAFYEATGGNWWVKRDNWCTDRPLSEWYGVVVADGRVKELNLPENALSGRIPPEIGDLTSLRVINLKNNWITGVLPDVFERLVKLQKLDLSGNAMEGNLPRSMGNLSQLRQLFLSQNYFTGRLPDTFVNLVSLEEIHASNAGLMGSVSVVPEGSPALRVIDLSLNEFTGGIPDAVYGLSQLRELKMGGNPISGIISFEVGNLTKLTRLDLSSTRISGELPSTIGRLTQLKELDLHEARMSGALPEEIGHLNNLHTLRLDNNMFSGKIPQSLLRHPNWARWWGSVLEQYGEGIDKSIELPSPLFSVKDLKGNLLSSDEVFSRNELTVLFQFKLDDYESSRIISELNKMYEDYKQFGMNVIGYAYEPREDIRKYADQLRIEWSVVPVDGQTGANDILRVPFFPAINLVSREGKTVLNCFTSDIDEAIAYIRNRFGAFKPYVSSDYSSDGKVEVLQKATRGAGIDVVLMGDGYSDRNIQDGSYRKTMRDAMEHFFGEEPFTSFRNCFNVYAVTTVSANEGYFTGSKSALGTHFKSGGSVGGDNALCRRYALRVPGMSEEKLDNTLVVVMMNSNKYGGTSYLSFSRNSIYGSGFAVCYFPIGKDEDMFAQLLHHEAGGHGFAKLADEYGTRYLPIPQEQIESYQSKTPYGWWRNVDFTADPSSVKWSRLLSDNRYRGEELGVFEGACEYNSGAYRPTVNSIMRDNSGGFNAPSREAIYMRIMWLAYGPEWSYDYEEFVLWDVRNRSAALRAPKWRAPERGFVPLPPPVVTEKR